MFSDMRHLTQFLDYMIIKKNKIHESSTATIPWSLGVYSADIVPDAIFQHENFHYNWISNIDDSSKPRRHWLYILLDKDIKRKCNNNLAECTSVTYYNVDSWGSKFYEKTCKTMTDRYDEQQSEHNKYMQEHNLKCICDFEINFPVVRRIQHSTYQNCGWFALYFTSMSHDELTHWSQMDSNTYGKIKQNYDNTTNYFRYEFFPFIDIKCKDYLMLKTHVNITHKCNSPCNQSSCCQKLVLPEYY